MIYLTQNHGYAKPAMELAQQVLLDFKEPLYGAEFGVGWGGGIEWIGKLWKDRGIVWGFDTFEGMPKYIGDPEGKEEANALDAFYAAYGTEGLMYQKIREELDNQGLDNVILVKGLISDTSCRDIPRLHYVELDLDMLESMQIAYGAVASKIVPNGYLLLHDYDIFPRLRKWIDEKIVTDSMWKRINLDINNSWAIFQREDY